MIKSTLSDTEIMEGTVQSSSDDKGRVQLSYTLPSGRKVTSIPTVKEAIKGGVLIGWCNTVRSEDEEDQRERLQNEEATAARKALGIPSSAPSATGADAKKGQTERGSISSVVEPEDLAKEQLVSLSLAVKSLEDSIAEKELELSRARKALEGWEIIAKELGVEVADDVPDMEDLDPDT